jgi:hypothetical protein
MDRGALAPFQFHLELQRKIVTLEARDAFIQPNGVRSRFRRRFEQCDGTETLAAHDLVQEQGDAPSQPFRSQGLPVRLIHGNDTSKLTKPPISATNQDLEILAI